MGAAGGDPAGGEIPMMQIDHLQIVKLPLTYKSHKAWGSSVKCMLTI